MPERTSLGSAVAPQERRHRPAPYLGLEVPSAPRLGLQPARRERGNDYEAESNYQGHSSHRMSLLSSVARTGGGPDLRLRRPNGWRLSGERMRVRRNEGLAGSRSLQLDGYLLGSYRIATAPEPNSSRLTSFKSTCFDSPPRTTSAHGPPAWAAPRTRTHRSIPAPPTPAGASRLPRAVPYPTPV